MRRVVCALALVACTGTRLPSARVPEETERGPIVILASGPLLEPLDKMARHAWFAVKMDAEGWQRWEVWMPDDCTEHWGWVCRNDGAPLSWNDDDTVIVHATLDGEAARTFIQCLRERSPKYSLRDVYVPVPGPNSNTYVDRMLRECDWNAQLPPTAVGKDFHLASACVTTAGTGVQLETAPAGVLFGLYEGIEVHVIGLTVGVSFWPPAIKLPFGTGRMGFEPKG
jgi:hypothetical protein